jgi:hypothetical protein
MEQRVVRVSPHIDEALVIKNLQLRQELAEKNCPLEIEI